MIAGSSTASRPTSWRSKGTRASNGSRAIIRTTKPIGNAALASMRRPRTGSSTSALPGPDAKRPAWSRPFSSERRPGSGSRRAVRGARGIAKQLGLTLQIGRQIRDAPVMLLQEPGEIGALGEGEPNALDLDVGHDRPAIGGLADAESGLERLR